MKRFRLCFVLSLCVALFCVPNAFAKEQKPVISTTFPSTEVSILSIEAVEGLDTHNLEITCSWSHSLEEKASFNDQIEIYVYQNGIECDSAKYSSAFFDKGNAHVDIGAGETLEVASGYRLSNTTDPLEIEVFEDYGENSTPLVFRYDLVSGKLRGAEDPKPKATRSPGTSNPDQFVFPGNITMAMPREDVISAMERKPDYAGMEYIYYLEESFDNLPAAILFTFNVKDLLDSIVVVYEQDHGRDYNAYVEDYEAVESALLTYYGDAWDKVQYEWFDTTYKGQESKLGQALKLGHVEIRHMWNRKGIIISHVLQSSDGDGAIDHSIYFFPYSSD